MHRTLIAAMTLGFAAGLAALMPAHAQEARITRLEVLESGFFTAQRTGDAIPAPGGVGGRSDQVKDVIYLGTAPVVTAQIGTNFGVRFRTVGSTQGEWVNLKAVWTIPAPGITNPKSGTTYRESVEVCRVRVGETSVCGYGLDDAWEVVRGVWTLEIWENDRKLLEKSFTIQ